MLITLRPRQVSKEGAMMFLFALIVAALLFTAVLSEFFYEAEPFKPGGSDPSDSCLSTFILVNLMPNSLLKSFIDCSCYC